MIHRSTRPPRASAGAYRRTALHVAIVGLALAGAMPPPAQAQASATPPTAAAGARDYAIPAGALSPALSRFAGQAGVTLSSDPALTDGLTTRGLQGRHGTAEGFARLLQGSGLRAVGLGGGVYRLERMPAEGAATLSAVTVTAQAERSALTEGINSYASSEMSMAKGQAIREIPQSVSVITRQQIEDQNLNTIDDVLKWTPGVVATGSNFAGRQGGLYARGMRMRNLQVDGSSTGAVGNDEQLYRQEGSNAFGMAIYDHVEVLRGSDGLYSGVGDSAGTVNLVRKRPTRTFQGNAMLSAGRWDDYQGQLDLSGPLAFAGKLRGRVVVARQDKHAFYSPSGDSANLFYGILEADLGPRTTLAVGATYNKSWGVPQGEGLPSSNDGSDFGFSRSFSGIAPWSRKDHEASEAFVDLKHQINDAWSISARLSKSRSDYFRKYAAVSGYPINDGGAALMKKQANGYDMEASAYDINVSGSGQIFGKQYSLLFGMDGRKSEVDEHGYLLTGRSYNFEPFNIYQLDWSNYPDFDATEIPGINYKNRQKSFYGRIRYEILQSLSLIVGGRYTDYKYDSRNFSWGTFNKVKESGILTPYLGLTYDISDQWTIYGSTAKIYTSQAGSLKGPQPGSALDPMEGRTYELGAKTDWLGGRLNSAFALYRIEKTGEAVRDPAYPGFSNSDGNSCCYLNKGEVLSQGFEMTVHGEILPRLQISAGYTYNNIKDKQNGNIPYNTLYSPKHLVKVFGKYAFSGSLSRLEVGGGVTAQSSMYGKGNATSFRGLVVKDWTVRQGGYAVWSAFANYRINEQTQIALNIDNLFDKVHFSSLYDPWNGRHYGEPRKYTLTLRTSF